MGTRSFIAIELSAEAKKELTRVVDFLKEAGASVKWVKPGSIHLTLKFLGDVPEDRITDIESKLKPIAESFPSFSMTLEGIGVFPDWKYVKVIWAGIGEGSSSLEELAEKVDEAMASAGFEKEKRAFKSHLTLGRVRNSKRKKELKEKAQEAEMKPVVITASSIVLFKSELTSEGAVHTPLAEFHLAE